MGEGGRVVAGAGMPRAGRRAEQDGAGVDLILAQREAVAEGRGGDDLRAQLRAGAGDQNLERLGRVLGLLVRPQPLHQPGGAAAPAQVIGEKGEQTVQARSRNLLVAEGRRTAGRGRRSLKQASPGRVGTGRLSVATVTGYRHAGWSTCQERAGGHSATLA